VITLAANAQFVLLPERLAWHIFLSLTALAIGIAISIPLALVCSRLPSLRGIVLGAAGVIQTVPSLALLALMVVLLGTIGLVPALIALTLYSILPILRNTVTGLANVDPAIVEAAQAMGMTQGQTLLKVQLPLAAPVIIAGIRTAAVWVVGIATLSTPVGQTSLGNYIFEGLQLRNNFAVAVGVAAAAALAIVLDLLIRFLELASQRHSFTMAASGLAAIGILAIAGTWPLFQRQSDLVIGAKTFTEQYILAEAVTQRLSAEGFHVRKVQGMGSSILFDSLANGNVACYVDYSGTLWTTALKRTDRVPRHQMIQELRASLKDRYGIVCVGPLGFENTYALAMRRDRAAALGIRTIADLAAHAGTMSLGGDYEFFGRTEWTNLRKDYGLTFAKTVGLDSTLMYRAVQDGQVDVICAFSTDGRIAAYDLLVLEDPRESFPPYDALLLVSRDAAAQPGFIDALQPLIRSMSNEGMRQANRKVDVDGADPHAAAVSLIRHGPP
jgi:osmoprotectant transport system permease protein